MADAQIGKHLATFNLFRERDGIYVTIADAGGVVDADALRAVMEEALTARLLSQRTPAQIDEDAYAPHARQSG